eukprot:3413484-Rhodomonas_salina.2
MPSTPRSPHSPFGREPLPARPAVDGACHFFERDGDREVAEGGGRAERSRPDPCSRLHMSECTQGNKGNS